MTNEEIIGRLERMAEHAVHVAGEPPFIMSLDDGIALDEAVRLLKEQEPRVLTLEELIAIGQIWTSNTPPYLFMDINPSIRRSCGFWCAWCDLSDMISGLHPKYTNDNYGIEWRCWTARPTDEQREATPWQI